MTGGHLDHHALARHEEGGDEDEEDVVEEQGGQQDCADPQARKAQHFQHVDAEHDSEEVLKEKLDSVKLKLKKSENLKDPRPILLAENEPRNCGSNTRQQERKLPWENMNQARSGYISYYAT